MDIRYSSSLLAAHSWRRAKASQLQTLYTNSEGDATPRAESRSQLKRMQAEHPRAITDSGKDEREREREREASFSKGDARRGSGRGRSQRGQQVHRRDASLRYFLLFLQLLQPRRSPVPLCSQMLKLLGERAKQINRCLACRAKERGTIHKSINP